MNKDLSFFTELDDEKIEKLLCYSSYNDKSLDNIKNRVKQETSQKRKCVPKRILITAAAIVLLCVGTVTAAANLDRIYQILFSDNAGYMQNHSQNIGLVTEAEGIEVRLLSALNYDRTLTLVLSIQDKEGNRIDKSTEFDSKIYFDGKEEMINQRSTITTFFNKESREFIQVETLMLPMNAEVGELTYTIGGIRSRRVDRSGQENQIDLYGTVLNHIPSTIPEKQERPQTTLAPEETHIPFSNVDWSYISNIGFIDGCLHIQVKDDPFKMDNGWTKVRRGWLFPVYLIDSDGRQYGLENEKTYNFPVPDWENGDTYAEYVFEDITEIEQLKSMTLVKEGYEFTEIIAGKWSIPFTVPSETEFLTIPVKKEIPLKEDKELYADSIIVTPLYVNVTYLYEDIKRDVPIWGGSEYLKDTQNFITYDDGSIIEFNLRSYSFLDYSGTPLEFGERLFVADSGTSENKEANVRYSKEIDETTGSVDIIEVNKVKSVTIQGLEFKVNK
ncbi:hypothetical protein [Proteiniphilum sp. UBA5510]|jgi:hypothetical protein|uniref:hypothetical protein n=1 Tax=Proteiniphilum sp. UBA5510 TaxID=1947286 RepID=UPI0025811780|nr:hypothetical protein [Proteiniphilum sp. UBA5510]